LRTAPVISEKKLALAVELIITLHMKIVSTSSPLFLTKIQTKYALILYFQPIFECFWLPKLVLTPASFCNQIETIGFFLQKMNFKHKDYRFKNKDH
jgi:hypothetical protein